MKPEIHLPRVNSGKISLGKTMFPRAKVRSVTTANDMNDIVMMIGMCQRYGACNLGGNPGKKIRNVNCNMVVFSL